MKMRLQKGLNRTLTVIKAETVLRKITIVLVVHMN